MPRLTAEQNAAPVDRTPPPLPPGKETRLLPSMEQEIRRLLAEYALRVLLNRRQEHPPTL